MPHKAAANTQSRNGEILKAMVSLLSDGQLYEMLSLIVPAAREGNAVQ
jgi:hypothetical protein